MPDLQLPDGRIIKDIPEGLTKDQVTSKLVNSGILTGKEDWLKAETAQPQAHQGILSSILKGVQQIPEGLGNIAIGATQAITDIVDPNAQSQFSQNLAKQVGLRNEQASHLSIPEKIGRGVGEIAPFLPVGAGMGLIPGAVASGAASSALSPQEDPGALNRLKETGTGAAVSGLTAGVLKGGATLAKKGFGLIAPTISQQAVKDFATAGIKPTLADVSDSNGIKLAQAGLQRVPLAGSPITAAKNEALDAIKNQLLKVEPSTAATQEQAGTILQKGASNYVDKFKKVSGDMYDNLDKYVLSETQKSTSPKLMGAIDEWTKLKELESHLTQSVNANTMTGGFLNANAQEKLGFWRNRGRDEASKYISTGAEDAKSLDNVKKQISNQEDVISGFEKYMSPQQFKSALAEGTAKVKIPNLARVADEEISKYGDSPNLQQRIGNSVAGRIIGDISADAASSNGNLPYTALKKYRTIVGNSLGDKFTIGDADRPLLKNIYGALSEDMKNAIVENSGSKGLEKFNSANTFYNKGIADIEANLSKTINSKVPEQVFNQAFTGTKQGGTKIRGIFKTLNPDEQGTVRSTFINKIGVNDKTGEFVPQQFIAKYNQISPEAKSVIFTSEQRSALDNLNNVMQRISGGSKLGNHSNTLSNIAIASAEGYGAVSHPLVAGGLIGGGYIGAKLMTNPTFINFLAKAEDGLAKGSTTMPKVIKGLSLMASQNPDYRNDIRHLIQSVDANAAEPTKDDIKEMIRQRYAKEAPWYKPSDEELDRFATQELNKIKRK